MVTEGRNIEQQVIDNREYSTGSAARQDNVTSGGLTAVESQDEIDDRDNKAGVSEQNNKPAEVGEGLNAMNERASGMAISGPSTNVTITPQQHKDNVEMAQATMGIDSMINTIKDAAARYKPETEEERRKREKRERSKKIIGAVSDGLRALGNLYFTSQYSPNMYNHEKTSMLDNVYALGERMRAERERDADKYYNYSLKIGDLQNQKAAIQRDIAAQQERQQLAREKAKREAEEHKWQALLQPEKQREAKGKADKAGYEADYSRLKTENAPAELENKNRLDAAKVDSEVARAGSYRASAANSYASASAHGRSNPMEYRAQDRKGKMHYFKDKDAAELFAKQEGTWVITEEKNQVDKTDTDKSGSRPKTKESSTTTIKQGGYPEISETQGKGRKLKDHSTPKSGGKKWDE